MPLQEKSLKRLLNERTRKIIDKFDDKFREIMVRQKLSKKDFDFHNQMSRSLKFISTVKPFELWCNSWYVIKSRSKLMRTFLKTFGFECGPVGFRFWDFFRQTLWWTVWTLTRNNAHNWEDEVKRFVFFFCFRLSLPWRIWKNLFTALKNTIRQCCRKARVCCTMYIPIKQKTSRVRPPAFMLTHMF